MDTNSLDRTMNDTIVPTEGETRNIVLPGQTPEGNYILSVLVKRTYDIVPDGPCKRAGADTKIVPGDLHYEDPMNSSVELETDFVPYKTATDIVFNGKVYAPGAEPVQELTASLAVGPFQKVVHVIGDRFCRHQSSGPPVFTDPIPFVSMDLRYERAYGGVDIYSDPTMPCIYARNHLGKGFVIGKDKKQIEGLELPNIENPEDLLTPERLCAGEIKNWENQPMPQGMGWFCKYWQPRAGLAGVMPADRELEQQLRQVYTRAVPEEQRELYAQTQLPDMDFRFFNGASEGLVVPFLNGDEQIRLTNLVPQGELSFELPADKPRIGLDIGREMQTPPVFLHTVMIRMEENQVDLVWRAAVPYPGPDWLPQMQKMEVMVQ